MNSNLIISSLQFIRSKSLQMLDDEENNRKSDSENTSQVTPDLY